jgi:hypothetical protein
VVRRIWASAAEIMDYHTHGKTLIIQTGISGVQLMVETERWATASNSVRFRHHDGNDEHFYPMDTDCLMVLVPRLARILVARLKDIETSANPPERRK